MLSSVDLFVLGLLVVAGGAAWLAASGWALVFAGVLLILFGAAAAAD